MRLSLYQVSLLTLLLYCSIRPFFFLCLLSAPYNSMRSAGCQEKRLSDLKKGLDRLSLLCYSLSSLRQRPTNQPNNDSPKPGQKRRKKDEKPEYHEIRFQLKCIRAWQTRPSKPSRIRGRFGTCLRKGMNTNPCNSRNRRHRRSTGTAPPVLMMAGQKGGERMSERERKTAEVLAEAVTRLPDSKKEYLLGYAEGVAAMADKAKAEEAEADRKEEPA